MRSCSAGILLSCADAGQGICCHVLILGRDFVVMCSCRAGILLSCAHAVQGICCHVLMYCRGFALPFVCLGFYIYMFYPLIDVSLGLDCL